MVTRYVVTHIGRDGVRTLAQPQQGRHTYATAEEAQHWIDLIQRNNSHERLQEFFGLPLEVRPVECWPVHHDPKAIFFDI